jgi:outer membrane protein assembly complex protein YaeT
MSRHAVLLLALVAGTLTSACAPGPRPGAPYPAFAQYEGWEVRRVRFVGETQIAEDSLRRVILTHAPRCVIPILPRALCPGFARRIYQLDLTELARDVSRLQLYYRDYGYYGTRIIPAVEPIQRGRVEVRFSIGPGDIVTLRRLEIQGAGEVLDTARVRRNLPLQEDEPFRRSAFVASADSIRAALVRRGYAYGEVLRNYDLDTIANVAQVNFDVIPGPQVRLDTVIVLGNYRLEPRTVQRMLGLQRGQVVNLFELSQSQRYLYGLGLVRFASVQLAPDTLRVSPDPADATVLVRIVEAPRYAANVAAGYGTLDCLRTEASAVDRNFLGGARRLELTASASKIGVGHPAALGFENSLCRSLQDDVFSDTMNYRLAAHFRQPRLFGTLNELAAGLHAERQSQLNAYMRQSIGGNLAVTRELGEQARGTVTAEVQRGYTTADPVVFCATFGFCAIEDFEWLIRPRWSNSLAAQAILDRTQTIGARVEGYQLRGGVDWASPILGSEDQYLGLIGQATAYRPMFRPGWVVAGRLQGGLFVDPGQGFIPPQRRFYAGGANSVRGFQQNTLGPLAYVRRFEREPSGDTAAVYSRPEPAAIGGTRMVVASAELRTPSPWFRDFMRLAYFVDAGQVWAPEALFDVLDIRALRVTPGVGVRFATPVGPIRFDVGYNPYPPTPGPLFREADDGILVLDTDNYAPRDRGFWQRLAFHLAVGQAF